jgi:hypothetical protein
MFVHTGIRGAAVVGFKGGVGFDGVTDFSRVHCLSSHVSVCTFLNSLSLNSYSLNPPSKINQINKSYRLTHPPR